MFDPTAYENMKVILEGYLYDYDMQGEILIKERNDLINLADMSRTFSLLFSLNLAPQAKRIHVYNGDKLEIKAEFHADLWKMASEWYPLQQEGGAEFNLYLRMYEDFNEVLRKRVDKFLHEQFSHEYYIHWEKTISQHSAFHQYLLKRKQPLFEEEADRIPEMVDAIIDAVRALHRLIDFPG
ncbi:MAG: hypothetical protein C6P37_08510 [Caldibacillus debilis]|jgi:hypothetical protein|uniref:Uncharacterized protein n=1 Tax=Caldibacillus debilis TaxID=301148 RepID=A0A150MCS3_9BACI|nr:hypothetical protein [Caldibacillus debilis]MBO2480710.1 hypothetical protein [Bacillaceae bacterium]KYD22330.1 hypothetical protein B4135_1337 [Caldibacillus debilis]MBY6272829.1 hypothetical protein [Bacillaceae bacterium]OUM92287.1 MAG: hypothetical protein BAA03_11945 [Caldibacillus debilis]REJ16476.1 MAG: hypothetical protein C6W57_08210 [Caldibacillus debilis]